MLKEQYFSTVTCLWISIGQTEMNKIPFLIYEILKMHLINHRNQQQIAISTAANLVCKLSVSVCLVESLPKDMRVCCSVDLPLFAHPCPIGVALK